MIKTTASTFHFIQCLKNLSKDDVIFYQLYCSVQNVKWIKSFRKKYLNQLRKKIKFAGSTDYIIWGNHLKKYIH
jgi:hypothetical protein